MATAFPFMYWMALACIVMVLPRSTRVGIPYKYAFPSTDKTYVWQIKKKEKKEKKDRRRDTWMKRAIEAIEKNMCEHEQRWLYSIYSSSNILTRGDEAISARRELHSAWLWAWGWSKNTSPVPLSLTSTLPGQVRVRNCIKTHAPFCLGQR